MNHREIYKDYLIEQIFWYKGGKGDFHVFPDKGGEPGEMKHMTTLEDIKNEIDELIQEENGRI